MAWISVIQAAATNTGDLIKDIYGSVMYSPATVKTRMTSLVAAAEEFGACVTSHKLV